MPLYRIKDFDPNYRDHFGNQDITRYDIYSRDEKVGSVQDLLVDETGRIRYFVVNTGSWIAGKDVLLPIGQARIEHGDQRVRHRGRVYADGLTRDQVERLPRYDSNMTVDYDQEENTRAVYRSVPPYRSIPTATVETSVAVEDTIPVDSDSPVLYQDVDVRDRQDIRQPMRQSVQQPVQQPAYPPVQPSVSQSHVQPSYDRNTYRYEEHDPNLYRLNESDHQNIRLYEERLIASKSRQKVGEVAVGKRVETDMAQVAVPVEKERIVIERRSPSGMHTVPSGQEAFRAGEVARAEVYEERADIHKETAVREEVSIRKDIDRDTVEARDTVRREQLDIDVDGEHRRVGGERLRDRR